MNDSPLNCPALFYPEVSKLGKICGKVYRRDNQPIWKPPFLVDCIAIFSEEFWIQDRTRCERLIHKCFFLK